MLEHYIEDLRPLSWDETVKEYMRLIRARHRGSITAEIESRAAERVDTIVFARESCLLSKVDPDRDLPYFKQYAEIAGYTINSSGSGITNPAITNAAICGHAHYFTFRTGSIHPDPNEEDLPIGDPQRYLKLWMRTAERIIVQYQNSSYEEKDAVSIALHDALIYLHPFDEGNSRTARIHLQEHRRELGIPMVTFRLSEKKANKARIKFFEYRMAMPFLRRHGRL